MDIPQERKLVTEVPGPKSLALFERRTAAIPPGVANIHPIVTARARLAVLVPVFVLLPLRFLPLAAVEARVAGRQRRKERHPQEQRREPAAHVTPP